MAANLNPKNPLTMGLLALAGFWLLTRSKAATPKQAAVINGAQTYNTPTSMAAALASFVAAYTKGATPSVRTDNVVGFDWRPWSEQATEAAANWTAKNPALGTFTFGAGGAIDTPGWGAANISYVTPGNNGGQSVDQYPSGMVYDVGTDYVNNPFAAVGL